MQHPTATNITVVPGVVRGIKASSDMASVQSVIVRELDGTLTELNDVALVAGEFLSTFLLWEVPNSCHRLHWDRTGRFKVASQRWVLPSGKHPLFIRRTLALCHSVFYGVSRA
jgi:hypothetical protein